MDLNSDNNERSQDLYDMMKAHDERLRVLAIKLLGRHCWCCNLVSTIINEILTSVLKSWAAFCCVYSRRSHCGFEALLLCIVVGTSCSVWQPVADRLKESNHLM